VKDLGVEDLKLIHKEADVPVRRKANLQVLKPTLNSIQTTERTINPGTGRRVAGSSIRNSSSRHGHIIMWSSGG
jgi:hypothetical protein